MKIGIIGAGQLGRMLALAGYPLGLQFRFLDRDHNTPGGQVGDLLPGAFDDLERLQELARSVDVLTFEFENVPAQALSAVAGKVPFLPPPAALATAQDRLSEKRLFSELGIGTPAYHPVDSRADLESAVAATGLPAVLKTRRLGYDGRGQYVLRAPEDLDKAWAQLGSVPLILEAFVAFEREVSVIAVRSTTGEQAFYPLADNTHEDGILRLTRAPFENAPLQAAAEEAARQIMTRFDYAGILTIEFFVTPDGLLANEMAPRVHNSGHWTIEGSVCSQFENHLRAILGLPLGSTRSCGHSAMLNLLGELPDSEPLLRIPGVHWHDYGKSARPGRKLGHCTVNAATREECDRTLDQVLASL